ncbi:MAG: hypothetical protein FJ271_20760 [Planctomycetes bacterium]|nr:hypothetical protein [Planctomycetota bacterium]
MRNNLILAKSGPDIVFSGKDQLALEEWRFDHNWRQVQAAPETPEFMQWVRSPDDTVKDHIDLPSLDPQNRNFLCPAKDSPLASAGVGGDLPRYVGALPPEGVEMWDWSKTWNARARRR